MYKLEDVAVAFETDWTMWGWVIAIAISIAAILVLWWAPALLGLADLIYTEWVRWASLIGVVVISLAALAAVLILPGMMFRHTENQGVAFLIGLAWLGVATYFWFAHRYDVERWVRRVPAGAIAIGVVTGAASDAVTRAAASVPMTVSGFLALCLIGGAIIWAKFRES